MESEVEDGSECKKQDFEFIAITDGEPVEGLKEQVNVLWGTGSGLDETAGVYDGITAWKARSS